MCVPMYVFVIVFRVILAVFLTLLCGIVGVLQKPFSMRFFFFFVFLVLIP